MDKTGYEPWFTPIWEPTSGEIESMFFCLQAALGSAVVFFLLGYWYGQSRKRKEEN
ncbi:MAG: cobalt transport protein CbiN [Methanocorpusculum sp.]|nr:cobalt transport protein CbiN [Methanocorpusculum sp.]